jgi:hypothetical protein
VTAWISRVSQRIPECLFPEYSPLLFGYGTRLMLGAAFGSAPPNLRSLDA